MRLMAICMAIIVAIGYLLGGRLRNVSDLQIEWTWLALAGLALQFVTGPGSTVPLVCLYLSFGLLIVFTIKNIRVFGFPVILAGVFGVPTGPWKSTPMSSARRIASASPPMSRTWPGAMSISSRCPRPSTTPAALT